MRVAVIGTGVAGRSHLLDAVTNPDLDVVAVASAHRDRAEVAARDFGVPACFNSASAMLSEAAVDAVVVATPPAVTPPIIIEAARAGCAVLVDKPAAATAPPLADVQGQLGGLAARIVVGYNRRYQSHVQRCRDLLVDASAQQVRCLWTGPFSDRYRSPATYRRTATWGHGVLLDTASHILDTLQFLGLGPISFTGGHLGTGSGIDADVEADLRLGFRDICAGQVTIRDAAGQEDNWRVEITADHGCLALSRSSLTGTWDGSLISVAGRDLRRPVDDLLALAEGAPTCGATLREAIDVLDVIDTVRNRAGLARRQWQRPRAKALGRLNGAC